MAMRSKNVDFHPMPRPSGLWSTGEKTALVRATGEAESSRESQALVRKRRFRGEYLDIEYLTDGRL